MTNEKKGVGRPPEVDSDGNKVDKVLVNLTIPVKLKNFLDKHVENRSAFFTRVVTMLYVGEICFKCYSDKLDHESRVGVRCEECKTWVKLVPCPNCGERYDPRRYIGMARNPNYNPFVNDDLKSCCSKCIEVK